MVCCALIAIAFAVPLWAHFKLRAILGLARPTPLSWRPHGASSTSESDLGSKQFRLSERIASFRFAFRGIGYLISREHNAWLHLIAAAGAITSGVILEISFHDWRWIVCAIALVLSAEAFNTAIEWTTNVVSPGFDERVRIAKDVAAGAVLLSAIGAALIGLLTLLPYLAPGASLATSGHAAINRVHCPHRSIPQTTTSQASTPQANPTLRPWSLTCVSC